MTDELHAGATSTVSMPSDLRRLPSRTFDLQLADLARQAFVFRLKIFDSGAAPFPVRSKRAEEVLQRAAHRLMVQHRARAGDRLDSPHTRRDTAFGQ